MRTTTVELNEELLERAQEILGTGSIKDTVNESLRAVVRQRQLHELAEALGTVKLELTPAALRKQRRKRTTNVSR